MSNSQAAAFIVGLVMPFLISFVTQAGLNKWWNLTIAALSCAGVGVLTVWATGQLTAANILGTIAAVFLAAQVAYRTYWSGTAAEQTLNEATSVVKSKQ